MFVTGPNLKSYLRRKVRFTTEEPGLSHDVTSITLPKFTVKDPETGGTRRVIKAGETVLVDCTTAVEMVDCCALLVPNPQWAQYANAGVQFVDRAGPLSFWITAVKDIPLKDIEYFGYLKVME